MDTLQYRSFVDVDALETGQCTLHRAQACNAGPLYWNLWVRVAPDAGGESFVFCVPVNPCGGYIENGPGGPHTWGLTRVGDGWLVSPSINVLESGSVYPGEHPSARSLWHRTPVIVGVPDVDTWTTGAAP